MTINLVFHHLSPGSSFMSILLVQSKSAVHEVGKKQKTRPFFDTMWVVFVVVSCLQKGVILPVTAKSIDGLTKLQRWRWSTNDTSGRTTSFYRCTTNIICSNEKMFVLFASRWRIDSTDDNNKAENDETPLYRTYQTSSYAPMQLWLRYSSMEVVLNSNIHNWRRCCWQFPDLWFIFNWFTSFGHGQSSDLSLWNDSWAQINDTTHM